ncbi:MAG TPA: 6-hydroxymethylpterin diphosphokinase MptE-like protein [Treponemataceae bacterium]|nr:6-hydroxymethylpterin diphosphokinase MptE-like protein [Treponemataceae bacterium]
MNSILNSTFAKNLTENITIIEKRFPDLAQLTGLSNPQILSELLQSIPNTLKIEGTPSQYPTLSANNTYFHSRYNPKRDAERAIGDTEIFPASGCIFLGTALAYIPELYAQNNPDSWIIIIEPDLFVFIQCLKARSLCTLLMHQKLVLLLGISPYEAVTALERMQLSDLTTYQNPSYTIHNPQWFNEFTILVERNKQKSEINSNTLKRFGDLWLKNMSRNLCHMKEKKGIELFKGLFHTVPALLVAAGPSLDDIIPHLPRLAKHCVIIAVDTAVRACIRAGVEPDFILLVDPQYWNWRHLDGLSCPNSILITEAAAWPPVFRFQCKSIHLCSSLFPLGKFIEQRTEKRGTLGAGGSVSTTAWDFACHIGASPIYVAGLDLGFPHKRTHFSGSIFEERTHSTSTRIQPAETTAWNALYSAGPYPVPNYKDGTVLTDKRLNLYAWWFESKLVSKTEHQTTTLNKEGVKIPGFLVGNIDSLFSLPEKRDSIAEIIESTFKEIMIPRSTEENIRFDSAIDDLKKALYEIKKLAQKALCVCKKHGTLESHLSKNEYKELSKIDQKILEHPAKEVAAMVFNLAQASSGKENGSPLSNSLRLYTAILQAVEKNIYYIESFY